MLFSDIDVNTVDHIIEPIDNLRYSAKAHVYTQGKQGDVVYSIRNGLVKLVQSEANGAERTVRILGASDVMGLEALVAEPYRQTAIVLEELSVCRIPLETLAQLEDRNPLLNNHLMMCWDRHLELSEQWITKLSSGPVKIKLINFLLMLIDLNEHKKGALQLINHGDIASIIGTSRETVSRIMVDLREEGIIHKGSTSREITFDKDKLKSLVI